MKRLNFTAALSLLIVLFNGCKTEPDSAAVKKEVLNIHDKLMMDGEKVVKNRIILDSVLKSPAIKSAGDSSQVADLIVRLNQADENMMDWMHFFKDDFKGKDEQENLDYYKTEMIKIRAVEDEYLKVIRKSDSVLKVYHVAPAQKMEMKKHMH